MSLQASSGKHVAVPLLLIQPDPVYRRRGTPIVSQKRQELLSAAHTQVELARLIAAAAPHSGDFLHAVPCSSVGIRLDDTSMRIAAALRLGSDICASHTCIMWSDGGQF